MTCANVVERNICTHCCAASILKALVNSTLATGRACNVPWKCACKQAGNFQNRKIYVRSHMRARTGSALLRLIRRARNYIAASMNERKRTSQPGWSRK